MTNAGEKAMALVDGQLAPTEVPALVQELARNAALVAELQDYLAMSRSRIAQAFAAKADEPVPRRLIDAVMETPIATGRRGLPLRLSPRDGWSTGWGQLSRARMVAGGRTDARRRGVCGRSGNPARRPGWPGGPHGRPRSSLERTASGKETALATVRPMLSFNSKDAGWCRQFEVRGARKQILPRSGLPRPGRRLAGGRVDSTLCRRQVRAGWCRSAEIDR